MIIWLASYPKSGNTWVRLFLNSLIYTKDNLSDINNLYIGQFPTRQHFEGITNNVDDLNEFSKNCINAQLKLNLSNQIKFFKTHHAYWRNGDNEFTNSNTTLGVIYIVRDPRNVITSLKNHFNLNNYNDALNFLLNDKKVISFKNQKIENNLPHIISSWKNHFNSWKKMKKNYLLIKYEDLLHSPELEFEKITNYVEKLFDKKFEKKKILDAIDKNSFDKLKAIEKTNGFIEAPKFSGKPISFFNLGYKNNWKSLLETNISEQIEKAFKQEMEELDYI
tara:strand:- start:231 stop:1064 length:834 start_codon:yes stop_codon:yes gene_type:complete